MLRAAAGGGYLQVERLLRLGLTSIPLPLSTQVRQRKRYLEAVEWLLAAKANINAPLSIEGRIALQAAVGGGHKAVVVRLQVVDAHSIAHDQAFPNIPSICTNQS